MPQSLSLICIRALTLLLLLGSACKTPETSDRSYRETLPDEVRAEISSQIQRVFGDGPFRRIPLLDARTDWIRENNWPDKFSFQGHDFKAQYGTFGSDYFAGPDSRDALHANTGHYIKYKVDLPAPLYWHSFHCYWSKHGYVKEKGITWGHKDLFALQFYPDGNLFMFTRDQPEAGYRIDVYDRAGRAIGSNYNHSRYTWRGRQITSEAFSENLNKIWAAHFPPEA